MKSTRQLGERIRQWFPDREFFMRSQGQVRFIKISSRLQMSVAAIAIALGIGWAGSMGVMAWNQYRADADLASFEQEKARIATARERINAYGGQIERVVDELGDRQKFLEEMARMLPEDIQADPDAANVTDSSAETAETVKKVGALFPEARGLAEIEARQLALVERLTRFAIVRSQRAEAALRKLNLDPQVVARNATQRGAMGGPLELLGTAGDGSVDPRFEKLGLSLTRLAMLERVLEGIPQVVPASIENVTSGFGYRRDPFTGGGAMHRGIDFKGAVGSPILAAGKGRVAFAGWKSGYGKMIEINHGNGMTTRYAHLSRIDVARGNLVDAGETLGGLGSTGRSTGPHLHFELRINNRAVNPRPFLETASDVLKEVRGAGLVRAAAKGTS